MKTIVDRSNKLDFIWLYITLLVFYLVFSITGVFLFFRSTFVLNRYINDACMNLDEGLNGEISDDAPGRLSGGFGEQ